MHRFLLLAAVVLALTTSCVPQPAPRGVAVAHVETNPAKLLQRLDLDIPHGLPITVLTANDRLGGPAPVVPPPFLARTQSPDDAARALDCLASALYYEARSQTDDGERAVAQVVLNRVRDPAFPKSVCGVVYQGSTRRTGCQFSFTCDGSMATPPRIREWQRAISIASAALAGAVFAPVGSATFYHANYVLPWWAASMTRVTQIGAHIFYRWRGAMENALAYRQSYAGYEPQVSGYTGGARGTTIAGGAAHDSVDGVQMVGGVAIHRGSTQAAASASATAAAPNAPAVVHVGYTGPTVERSRFGGVRVHRGTLPSGVSDDAGGAVTDSGDAPTDATDTSAT
jgi:hypothetical protein